MTRSDANGPIRTCVGCRERRPQADLHRCVLASDGRVRVSRTAPGRGAWICGPDCLDAARKGRGFERAWRRQLPPSATDQLRADLNEFRASPQRSDPGTD